MPNSGPVDNPKMKTALNIFLKAKKFPPNVDFTILDSASQLLIALLLIFDI